MGDGKSKVRLSLKTVRNYANFWIMHIREQNFAPKTQPPPVVRNEKTEKTVSFETAKPDPKKPVLPPDLESPATLPK